MEQAFLELIKSRRSIRSYRPDAIPKELLDAVLEAGTYAPSAMGRQSATIVAVTDKAVRDELMRDVYKRQDLLDQSLRSLHDRLLAPADHMAPECPAALFLPAGHHSLLVPAVRSAPGSIHTVDTYSCMHNPSSCLAVMLCFPVHIRISSV